jgi:hypothetical protein
MACILQPVFVCSASGVTASFGEMLLLMAIHFHSNQLSAICELVCSTLGMKVSADCLPVFKFAINLQVSISYTLHAVYNLFQCGTREDHLMRTIMLLTQGKLCMCVCLKEFYMVLSSRTS